MQTHLAAPANQVTGSYWDVRRFKDKVFIQKVSTLLEDLYRNREVRCVCSANGTVVGLYLTDGYVT